MVNRWIKEKNRSVKGRVSFECFGQSDSCVSETGGSIYSEMAGQYGVIYSINNSQIINDLRIPPANRLEKLTGKLKEYHSIRTNDQWRIIFQWINNDAYDVKIVDYH